MITVFVCPTNRPLVSEALEKIGVSESSTIFFTQDPWGEGSQKVAEFVDSVAKSDNVIEVWFLLTGATDETITQAAKFARDLPYVIFTLGLDETQESYFDSILDEPVDPAELGIDVEINEFLDSLGL